MRIGRLIGLSILIFLICLPLLVEAENSAGVFATVEERGRKATIYSIAETVGEALRENGIEPNLYEVITPAPTEEYLEGMHIVLDRVDGAEKNIRIAWDEEPRQRVINSWALPTGRQLIIQGGDPADPARPRVIINGMTRFKQQQLEELQRRGTKQMLATADSPHYLDTAPYTDGLSAIGVPAGYGLIAVDPRVIPLGALLYVEGYGYGLAADVGGAIKGKHVDLCFPVREQALLYGRQTVKVHIIG